MCMKLTVRLDVFFMTCEEVIFHFKVALISIGFATVRKIAIALKSENKSYFGSLSLDCEAPMTWPSSCVTQSIARREAASLSCVRSNDT